MNTNRSSYLLGAALGSALMFAVCAPANAADIYEGGLKGGYDVPPPPPSDRGIYFKGYIGQANPDVGGMWTEVYRPAGSFTVHHKDIKSSPLFGLGVGWQRNHWLRFDLTGEYRGDALFLGQRYLQHVRLRARTNTRPTSRAGSASPTPTSTWATGAASRPTSAPASALPRISVEGMRDDGLTRSVDPSVGYGADKTTTNFAYAFYAGASFDVTPQVALDLTYRWANLGSAQSGRRDRPTTVAGFDQRRVHSRTSPPTM